MKKILILIYGILLLAGCGKTESTQKQPIAQEVKISHKVAEGEVVRYYTFVTNAPYKIEFSISHKEMLAAESLLKAIDQESLENNSGRLFALNQNDRNFLPQYWQCIYHSMYQLNNHLIQRLAETFLRIQREQQLNHLQLAYAIIRFVQYMQYYIPPGIGIYSPARVLMEFGKGKEGPPPADANYGWHGA
ncbi:MAG: hypothetical protein N2316_08200, partial [Spirochaetes bacterium]|nr:hypothetical protein [Spirochaetota bacterium]